MINLDYLKRMAVLEQTDSPAFLALIDAYGYAVKPRPIAEYHEDIGPVLWWRFPITEMPYCGTPNDFGWPGYHTHFTALVIPRNPA